MKLNIACPKMGTQKMVPIDKVVERRLYDKTVGSIFQGELISPEFEGYVFKITGGDDLQGFPMRCGVLTTKRVRLLLKKGSCGYKCKRKGVRERKSVRGCIVSSEISVLSVVILSEGKAPIEGLTDRKMPNTHLPKRATKLRRMFNIPEDRDLFLAIKEIAVKSQAESGVKGKIPRIRITRLPSQERIEEKKKIKEERLKKKILLEKDRREYFEKYGGAQAQ
jgi:small subunit ribosomal protein S6e